MLCLVGNSPSSGSTLLADLLDSTPYTACGPELEFFCNRSVYEFTDYKANPKQNSPIHSFKATGIRFRSDHLFQYDLTPEDWDKMVQHSDSITHFADQFSHHFLTYRKKSPSGIVFEKTPQNVNAIDLFLKRFPTSYFVHIVRDPISVYWSLKKRKWGKLAAWATWLIYEAKAYPFFSHPRCIIIKYKDLVTKPFVTTANLINQIDPSLSITPEMVKAGFSSNEYRKNVDSIQSWDNQNRSTIQVPTSTPPASILPELAIQLDCKVNPKYAETHNISPITLRELMNELGYKEQLKKLENSYPETEKLPNPSLKDWRKIIPKWIKSLRNGNGKVLDLFSLIKPIVKSTNRPKT